MHDNSNASQAGSSLQPPQHIVVQLQDLLGYCEHEFAWLEDKRIAAFHHNRPHQILNAAFFAQIDVGVAAVLENIEFIAEPEVDRATAELFRRQLGRDLD